MTCYVLLVGLVMTWGIVFHIIKNRKGLSKEMGDSGKVGLTIMDLLLWYSSWDIDYWYRVPCLVAVCYFTNGFCIRGKVMFVVEMSARVHR